MKTDEEILEELGKCKMEMERLVKEALCSGNAIKFSNPLRNAAIRKETLDWVLYGKMGLGE